MAQDQQTPAYYIRHGMTCDEQMEKLYGAEAVYYFYLLSSFKYRFRAGYKGEGSEDLRKAIHCEEKAAEWKEKVSEQISTIDYETEAARLNQLMNRNCFVVSSDVTKEKDNPGGINDHRDFLESSKNCQGQCFCSGKCKEQHVLDQAIDNTISKRSPFVKPGFRTRTVFSPIPYPPYAVGDIFSSGDGSYRVCIHSNLDGEYDPREWSDIKSTDYEQDFAGDHFVFAKPKKDS